MKISKLILLMLLVMVGLLQSCKKDTLLDGDIAPPKTSNSSDEKTVITETYTIFEGYSTQPETDQQLLAPITEVAGLLEIADNVKIAKDTKAIFRTSKSGMVQITGGFKVEKGAHFAITKGE